MTDLRFSYYYHKILNRTLGKMLCIKDSVCMIFSYYDLSRHKNLQILGLRMGSKSIIQCYIQFAILNSKMCSLHNVCTTIDVSLDAGEETSTLFMI